MNLNETALRKSSLLIRTLIVVLIGVVFIFLTLILRGDLSFGRSQLAQLPFIEYLVKQRAETKNMAFNITLDFDRNLIAQISDYLRNDQISDAGSVEYMRRYYEKAVTFFPAISEIHGILGFVYYNLGKKELSLQHLLKAIELKPFFFWYRYDLALIYFKDKKYQDAVGELSLALTVDKNNSEQFIRGSGVYLQIFGSEGAFQGYPVATKLKNGYQKAYLVLLESYFALKDYHSVLIWAQQAINLNPDVKEFYHYAVKAAEALDDHKLKETFEDKFKLLEKSSGKNLLDPQQFGLEIL